jgi:hypothetical protein
VSLTFGGETCRRWIWRRAGEQLFGLGNEVGVETEGLGRRGLHRRGDGLAQVLGGVSVEVVVV